MTHKQPAAFGSPVFHICGATHLPASPSFPFGHTEERRTEGRIAGIVKHGHYRGYRTKRVGFMVTFRLFGAEKSVLKLVGANLKDGQNVLVL